MFQNVSYWCWADMSSNEHQPSESRLLTDFHGSSFLFILHKALMRANAAVAFIRCTRSWRCVSTFFFKRSK
ncbi:hypothetical protein MLD38_018484 [Melastoma candidum]|uniref:Uncharacterized protein n=1 Tax=Melastoma candidum TaxID=119954 RepID=A0ACB9QV17_9MYRT|nr:hypothetical protein MLD38_018484 [Melastoma candidum]